MANRQSMGLEPAPGVGASVRANASAHGLSFAPAISLSKRPATSIASPTPTSASGYGPPATATRLGKRAASPALTSLSSPTEPSSAQQAMRFTARSGEERADGSLRVVYAASIRDCRPCPLREQCQWEGHATAKPRQVSCCCIRCGWVPHRCSGATGAGENTDVPACSSHDSNASRSASRLLPLCHPPQT